MGDFWRKKLYIYFLVEVGDGVSKEKADMLDKSFREAIPELAKLKTDHADTDIYLRVMTYGAGAVWQSEARQIEEYEWRDIWHNRRTDISEVFRTLIDEMGFLSGLDSILPPVLFLMSATVPVENYFEPLNALKKHKIFRDGIKLAYMVDVSKSVRDYLSVFTGQEELVFSGGIPIAAVISHYIKWDDVKDEQFSNSMGGCIDLDFSDEFPYLSVRTLNSLKRAGINTLEELSKMELEEILKIRNLGKKSIEEIKKFREHELGFNQDNEVYTELNHPGRDKCDKLRNIRKRIAELNNIDYDPAECHHTGPCKGTCPVCDKELQYIDEQLQKKIDRGEMLNFEGIGEEEWEESGIDVDEVDFCGGDEYWPELDGIEDIPFKG